MQRRFSGISKLYGKEGFSQISQAHICVIGVGGVGSWVAEALFRSGIGKVTLIDMDHVAESNTNRQLQALEPNFGKSKVAVLKEHGLQINPNLNINAIEDFVTRETVEQYLNSEMTYVIDCIDSFRSKAAIINYCNSHKIKIITVGGTGGQIAPEKIRCTDLYKTEQDRLLAQTRRLLRTDYGFTQNPKRKFGVKSVWSIETPKEVLAECGTADSSLNCSGFGSAMTITASVAMLVVAEVLKSLGNEKTE